MNYLWSTEWWQWEHTNNICCIKWKIWVLLWLFIIYNITGKTQYLGATGATDRPTTQQERKELVWHCTQLGDTSFYGPLNCIPHPWWHIFELVGQQFTDACVDALYGTAPLKQFEMHPTITLPPHLSPRHHTWRPSISYIDQTCASSLSREVLCSTWLVCCWWKFFRGLRVLSHMG